jgi:transposase
MRPSPKKLSRAAMEARRLVALDLFRSGLTQARVARALGVSRTTTSRWAARVQTPEALLLRKASGRPPRVSMARIAEVLRSRTKWSTRTLAEAVFQATGVRYHSDHIFRRAKGAVA